MNLRSFCREAGYPRAIALTYSFDPLFFERIILRDLWHGGTGDITVVGDQRELQAAVERCAGQFSFLGQKYLLVPAETRGAFHPKLLLRVGPKGARLMLGSGNLTFFGWGGNRELGLDLRLDADQPDSSEIVNRVLDHIGPYLGTDAARNAVARLRDFPWLMRRDANVDHPLLLTLPDISLASQLRQRWAGRRFDRMLVFTGSTDEKGAFIDWCHGQFGVQKCVVAISPENSSFVQKEIAKLPVKVSLAPFTGSQRLHAKFYLFDGPDGPAAIVGSANCSRAAWLMTPADGGNVEAVHLYDAPLREEFAKVLELFPPEQVPVERVAPKKPDEKDLSELCPYQLKSILLQRGQECLEVRFNQVLSESAKVNLLGPEGISVPLQHHGSEFWTGTLTEAEPWPEGTTLAKAEVVVDEATFVTPLHWVDDLDAINKASHVKQIVASFGGLTRSQTASEHERVISDLAMIRSSLFTENAAYSDPQLRRNRPERAGEGAPQSEPVKPEDLVKSLNDLEIREPGVHHSLGPGMTPNMFGVMRALFEEMEASPDAADLISESKTSGEDLEPVGEEKKTESLQKNGTLREPPAEKYRQRLRTQLEEFFEKFASPEFEAECSATKLVQAAAYPLAVALLGEKGKWLTHEEARALITRVVDLLLNRSRPGSTNKGLLEEVGQRFRDKGQYDVFLQVVGDGTLWIALLAALAHQRWEEEAQRFERAINLSRVYFCDELRSDTSVGRLGALITRLQVEKARELVANEAPRVSSAMQALESRLQASFDHLLGAQRGLAMQVGDRLWHPMLRWGAVVEVKPPDKLSAYLHARGETVLVKSQSYLNLRIASEKEPVFKGLTAEVLLGVSG